MERKVYEALESYVYYPDSDNDLWCASEENLALLDADGLMDEYRDRLPD